MRNEEIRDLEDKIKYLLDRYDLWDEDSSYTFPDGETFYAAEFDYDEYDDSMDGDHASALASAGWGTDEDYDISRWDD